MFDVTGRGFRIHLRQEVVDRWAKVPEHNDEAAFLHIYPFVDVVRSRLLGDEGSGLTIMNGDHL